MKVSKYSDVVHQLPDGSWTVASKSPAGWWRPMTKTEMKKTGCHSVVYGGSIENYAKYHGPVYRDRSSAVRMAKELFGEEEYV